MDEKISVQTLFCGKLSKDGEDISDCQDAFRIKDELYAIADGATRSPFSAMWANLIVDHFCDNPNIRADNWKDWLFPIQQEWRKSVEERVENLKRNNNHSWIENQNSLNQFKSAISTFVGLKLECSSSQVKAEITIIGDSCVFILKDGEVKNYLIQKSADFNDYPHHLASYAKDNNYTPTFITEILEPDSEIYFLLATDALSKWILTNIENAEQILEDLIKIDSEESFQKFIINSRKKSNPIRLENDDVSLLTIKVNAKSGQITPTLTAKKDKASSNEKIENGSNGKIKVKTGLEEEYSSLLKKYRITKKINYVLAFLLIPSVIAIVILFNLNQSKKKQQSSQNLSEEKNSTPSNKIASIDSVKNSKPTATIENESTEAESSRKKREEHKKSTPIKGDIFNLSIGDTLYHRNPVFSNAPVTVIKQFLSLPIEDIKDGYYYVSIKLFVLKGGFVKYNSKSKAVYFPKDWNLRLGPSEDENVLGTALDGFDFYLVDSTENAYQITLLVKVKDH